MEGIKELSRSYGCRLGEPPVERVDLSIFTRAYPSASCFDIGCRDICCTGGATMDRVMFDRLIPHRSNFPGIPWEDFRFEPDPYSPGGQGVYTLFEGGVCMFQNRALRVRDEARGCGIHSWCLERGLDYRELKFFTCCLFPVEVNRIGDAEFVLATGYELRVDGYSLPCKDAGTSTVYREARENIAYYYGEDLIAELDALEAETLGGGL